MAVRPRPARPVVRLPDGQAEALHLRGGGAAAGRGPGPGGRRELLRSQGQAGPDHPARRGPGHAGGSPGTRPPAEAARPDRRPPLGRQHHLEPVRRHRARPLRGRRREARRLDGRGAADRGDRLLRLPALRIAEARPGLPGEGPDAGRARDRAQELPGAPQRARPHHRRQGEAVLEGELGQLGAPESPPRRRSLRPRGALPPQAPRGLPGRVPAHRAALARPPGLRLPELAVERGGEGLPARRGGRGPAGLDPLPGRHAPLPARARRRPGPGAPRQHLPPARPRHEVRGSPASSGRRSRCWCGRSRPWPISA